MVTLIVAVFNHSAARFFRGGNDGEIVEVASMVCPEARLPGRKLYSDAPSRTQDSSGARHAYEPDTTLKEKFSREFARKIADWLEAARVHHTFTRLALVASPDMLGAVRKTLSTECRKMVIEEYPKNLAQLDVETINAALPTPIQVLAKKQLGLKNKSL